MLNPVSILLVTMLSDLMGVAILGSLLPAGIPGVRRWIGGNALAIAGLVLVTLQGIAPALLSIVLANGIFALSIVLTLEGCRQFFDLRPALKCAYAGCAAVVAGIVYFTYVRADIDARIVVVSAFHAWMYAAIGWTAHRNRPPARPKYGYRFVTIAAWLGALGHLSRGAVYAAGWDAQAPLLQATPLNTVFLALGILAPAALTIGMVMLAHDRLGERLERFANFDELTGAMTRRAFIARANALLERARRSGEPLSLAIIDLDHFKTINDRYGHAAGDRVLHRFGRLMSVSVRSSDLFGRLGGEEFAVLFPGTRRNDALARLDAIRAKVRIERRAPRGDEPEDRDDRDGERMPDGAPEARVTFSAGVGECCPGDTLADWMARVDAALYAAKTAGRDRVTIAA